MRQVMAALPVRRPAPQRRRRRRHRRGDRPSGPEAGEAGPRPVMRAFAALALPEPVRFDLMILQQGLPVPRTVPPENLHLTLVFLGEIPGDRLEDVDTAFRADRRSGLRAGARRASTSSAAPARGWSMSAPPPTPPSPASRPRSRPRRAAPASRCPARRFVPHVTLARLPERFPDRVRLEQAIVAPRRLRGAAVRGGGLPPLPLASRRRGRGLRGAGALPARLTAHQEKVRRTSASRSARVMPMSRSRWSSSRLSCVRARWRASASARKPSMPRTDRRGRNVRTGRCARSWWSWSSPSSELRFHGGCITVLDI